MEKYCGHHHIIKHLHLSRFLKDKYNDLLIADTFRLVALSMISLFIPIFLLEIGYTMMEVVLMELGFFVGAVSFHYYTLSQLSKWGIKRTLVVSYLSNIILYLVLFYAKTLIVDFGKVNVLILIAILNIIPSVLYWSAHHVYFLKSTTNENQGEKLGLLLSIPALAGIASPFLGGILITNFDFKGAFLVSMVLLIIASVALFFSEDIDVDISLNFKEVLDLHRMKKNIIFFIDGFGYCAVGFIWPILLFFLSVQLISMGFLYLFSNAFYAAVSYLGGKKTDKGEAGKVGSWSAVGHGFSMIFRAISTTVIAMTTFQTMGGVFGGLLHVVIDAEFFKNTNKNYGSAIMNREFYMHMGRIFLIFLLILLLSYFPVKISLIVALILSGLVTFLLSVIMRKGGFFVNYK